MTKSSRERKNNLPEVSPEDNADNKEWLNDLEALDIYTIANTLSSEAILEEQREDR